MKGEFPFLWELRGVPSQYWDPSSIQALPKYTPWVIHMRKRPRESGDFGGNEHHLPLVHLLPPSTLRVMRRYPSCRGNLWLQVMSVLYLSRECWAHDVPESRDTAPSVSWEGRGIRGYSSYRCSPGFWQRGGWLEFCHSPDLLPSVPTNKEHGCHTSCPSPKFQSVSFGNQMLHIVNVFTRSRKRN